MKLLVMIAALSLSVQFAFLAAVLAPRDLFAASQSRAIFLLEEGTTWIYKGIARWQANEDADFRLKTGRIHNWKMRVRRTFRNGSTTVAIVEGFLFELGWYGYDGIPPRPGLTLIIQTADGLFEKSVSERDAERLAQEALDQKLKLHMDEDEILRLPVHLGDCLSTDALALKLKMWCWHVRGMAKTKYGAGWEVGYLSNPDRTIVEIVPGLGVTRYEYHHNGTVADTDVHLIRLQTPPLSNSQRH
jgi:hypothetical protein